MKLKTTAKYLRQIVKSGWLWAVGYCQLKTLTSDALTSKKIIEGEI